MAMALPLLRRQVMLLSAVATARSMAVRLSGRAAGGAMPTSPTVTGNQHHLHAGVPDRGCAFMASTTRPTSLSHRSRHLRHRHHCSMSITRRTGAGGGRTSQSLLPTFHSSASTAVATRSGPCLTRRYFSSSDDDEPSHPVTCPNKTGDRNGLIRHQILAEDGHPLRLYSRAPRGGGGGGGDGALLAADDGSQKSPDTQQRKRERSILLLHGRTWSSQPVFDLRTSDDDEKRQSTLQSLADLGFHAYALDLRGFGETPRDCRHPVQGYTTPNKCVADVRCAIDWITQRHGSDEAEDAEGSAPGVESPTAISYRPALLGWSQGALVAQMYAQEHGPSTLSDLILFGSIYDSSVIYPRKPLYDPSGRPISGGPNVVKPPPPEVRNNDVDSLEDFTLPGTICDEAALCYSRLALVTDPVKAAWDDLHEFNVINPALVRVPTLVVVGAQDPYTTRDAQRDLFERLGTEDRAMCVLPGCDHAAHILKARRMFVRAVAGFLLRKDGF